MGLLDPDTSDGRVIFFLPWLKGTIAGTTDTPCSVTTNPQPTEDEIQFILTEIKNYLNKDVEGKSLVKEYKLFCIKILSISYLQYEEVMFCRLGVEYDLSYLIPIKVTPSL